MKKLLLALLLSPLFSQAQISIEAEFESPVSVVHFSATGPKLLEVIPGIAHIIKLYDAPNAIWKQFSVPIIFQYEVFSVTCVSDHLFDNDDLVEYGVTYKKTGEDEYVFKVFEENSQSPIMMTPNGYYATPLKVDDNGTYKLSVMRYETGQPLASTLYSLPGELPCISCSGLKASNTNKQQPYLSEPIPNPSTGSFTVNYSLPMGESAVMMIYNITGQQVATYPLSANKNSIEITQRFIPGSYLYNIRTASGLSESKKLTIK